MVGATAILALLPSLAVGQERAGVTVGAFVGAADWGSFMEQRFEGGERELTASVGVTAGAILGAQLWDETGVRGSFTWSQADLEFEDDTGTGEATRGFETGTELSTFVFSIEVLRYFLDGGGAIAPYAVGGVNGTLWSLDEERAVDAAVVPLTEEDSQFRFGGSGGVGVEFRFSPALLGRLEANTFGLGSPFDGGDAFGVTGGETFDEPSAVRMTRLTAGLVYRFGGGR